MADGLYRNRCFGMGPAGGQFGCGNFADQYGQDGTKDGYDIPLTRRVSEVVGVPVIASGGAGELNHFYEVLTEGKADAVLAASVFHYGQFTVRQVKGIICVNGIWRCGYNEPF